MSTEPKRSDQIEKCVKTVLIMNGITDTQSLVACVSSRPKDPGLCNRLEADERPLVPYYVAGIASVDRSRRRPPRSWRSRLESVATTDRRGARQR